MYSGRGRNVLQHHNFSFFCQFYRRLVKYKPTKTENTQSK
jgi:hypothetical protein